MISFNCSRYKHDWITFSLGNDSLLLNKYLTSICSPAYSLHLIWSHSLLKISCMQTVVGFFPHQTSEIHIPTSHLCITCLLQDPKPQRIKDYTHTTYINTPQIFQLVNWALTKKLILLPNVDYQKDKPYIITLLVKKHIVRSLKHFCSIADEVTLQL